MLVFANKQDMPNAMAVSELTDKLGLQTLRSRTVSGRGAVPTPVPAGGAWGGLLLGSTGLAIGRAQSPFFSVSLCFAVVRAGNVRDPGHGALRWAGLAIARALQALAGPAARGPDEPGASLPTAVSFGFLCFIWGGGVFPFSPEWPRLCVYLVGLEPHGTLRPAPLRPPHLHVPSAELAWTCWGGMSPGVPAPRPEPAAGASWAGRQPCRGGAGRIPLFILR